MLSAAQLELLARRRVRHRSLYQLNQQNQLKSLISSQSTDVGSQAFLLPLIADELLSRLDYIKIQPQSLMLMCAGATQSDVLSLLARLRQLYTHTDILVATPDVFSRGVFEQVVRENERVLQVQKKEQKNTIGKQLLYWLNARREPTSKVTEPALIDVLAGDGTNCPRVDLCLPLVLPMASGWYHALNRAMARAGMLHGVVLSGLTMLGDFAIGDETKYECINSKSLGDMLGGQGFQEIVIDSWVLPLAYRSLDQMLVELSPWWGGQVQQEVPQPGLQGRKKLEQFKTELKQQTYVAATGLFELELECLFFQAIYDPLQVKKNEFSIFPDQIKIRPRS
jgi:hypothetical protein